jgi:outer membrane protein assembly factor BamB
VLYTLKEGGIFTSYDPKTGDILKQARLQGALGNYFASPVAADGKIYVASEDGKVTVIEAGPQWQILRVNEMDGACTATPAIVEGHLYIRTRNSLSRFAKRGR